MNFSSPYMDLPQRLTVRQNLTIYAKLYGIPALPARLKQLGADLDIAHFMDRPYGQLSAGQKTRVSLAKAFLNEPEVLLMDEPTASLDPDMADYVRNYLRAYQQRTGATMFFASHNMLEVERLCTDVLLLRAGKVVDRGSPRSLLARYGRRTMEEVFIDVARRREGADEPEPRAGAVS
jgi:ABC-2 type transport system ATP-binding protein